MREYYIKNVSGGNHPISMELSRYLYDLCWKRRPKKILDRGSGFSSFLFRKYAFDIHSCPSLMSIDRRRGLDIYTVDNKKEWLDKAKEFVEYCGLKAYNFYIWPEFLKQNHDERKYDLILEDFYFPVRPKSLPKIIELLAPNGYLILDDAHIISYKDAIYKAEKRFNITVKYLVKETADKSGRFSALIRKK